MTGTADSRIKHHPKQKTQTRDMQFFLERQRTEQAALDPLETQFGKTHLNILHLEKGTAVFLVRTVIGQTIF